MLPSRLLAVAGAVAIVAGASAARADFRIENPTDATLVFHIQCHGGGSDDLYRIVPHSYQTLYCFNGGSAEMRVYTRHPNGASVVVRGTVYNGGTYRLHYDGDGDVNVFPVG
jgi:hypothetical protein